MAFSQHRQIDVGPGDRVIISASAIPGNEKTIGRVINELFRKGVDVIYDRSDPLHVSATFMMFSMLRPETATFRPQAAAASMTCWMRWTLEAKVVTMITPSPTP